MSTAHSATLAINEAVETRRASGEAVLHLGFGEAGLPAPPGAVEALATSGFPNGYGPVAGTQQARETAAGWFTRRGLATDPGQIVFGPGSKPLLFALLAAIDGDVVLPIPAWVSYAAQAALLGRKVVPVPIPPEAGGIPDPARLDDALRDARARGADPKVLILTVPDNPTGTVAGASQLQAVCAIAERHGLAIICDEIYAELCHDGTSPTAATWLPERTVITTGLSKSVALGGWRIGYARTPASTWGRALHAALIGIASEMWSSLSAPMLAVANHVLGDPSDITTRIASSRRLHAAVASAVHQEFLAAGATGRPPRAGFYLYPDLGPMRAALASRGITTSGGLAVHLLERHGVATLPGSAFGEDDGVLTLRVATSLLYGSTPDQRLQALESPQPAALPWITESLQVLRTALGSLTDKN